LNILDEIVQKKRHEVEHLKRENPLKPIRADNYSKGRFYKKLRERDKIKIIAEVKRKSPSFGIIAEDFDPVKIAKDYVKGGASCISVLTDEKYFGGSIKHLKQIKDNISGVPVLRKDFIIDEYQIYESCYAGADAMLLITSILSKKQLKNYIKISRNLSIDPVVEVHDRSELEIALDCGAYIVGINNRNLKTFKVDLENSLRLIELIPDDIIKISESGIKSKVHVKLLTEAGFDAILIGTSLMKSTNKQEFLKKLLEY